MSHEEVVASTTPETLKNFDELTRNCMLGKIRHFSAGDRNGHMHRAFGTAVIVINVFLGSVFFYSVSADLRQLAKWVGGGFALLSAAIAGFQSFFGFEHNASAHRDVANQYNALGRRCEHIIGQYHDDLIDLKALSEELTSALARYAEINKDATRLHTTERDFKRALQREDDRVQGLAQRGRKPSAA